MGGRGARSGGRTGRAPNGYRTTGQIGSNRIIRNIKTGKGLPRQSEKASVTYLGTDGSGKVNQIRVYDKNKNVKKDIDWSHGFGGNAPGTVHSHTWKNGVRGVDHCRLTPAEIKRYRSLIEKATGRNDLTWEW